MFLQKPSQFRCYPAFTLIELLSTIGIMVLLLGLTIASHRNYQKKLILEGASQELVSLLKQAQMMSLTGEKIEGQRQKGYGLYLSSPVSYLLFADKDGDFIKDSEDIEIKTFNLPTNVTISFDIKNFIFRPPRGELFLDGLSTGSATITFSHSQISKISQVIVDAQTGRISVE